MTCVFPEPIMWFLVPLDTKEASREGKMSHGLMLKYEPTNFKNKLEKRYVESCVVILHNNSHR